MAQAVVVLSHRIPYRRKSVAHDSWRKPWSCYLTEYPTAGNQWHTTHGVSRGRAISLVCRALFLRSSFSTSSFSLIMFNCTAVQLVVMNWCLIHLLSWIITMLSLHTMPATCVHIPYSRYPYSKFLLCFCIMTTCIAINFFSLFHRLQDE